MKSFNPFIKNSAKLTKMACSLVFCLLFCSACVSSYEQTVQQGNIVSNSMLSQLQQGMSKAEVRAVLGTPLTNNNFNSDRWEYYYAEAKLSARKKDSSTFTLNFEDDRLSSVKGAANWDKIREYRESPDQQSTGGTVITKPTQKRKGLFSGLFKK